ncbi:MAG: helix-turn-helix domain-containing protein, partial [Bacteroidota bacterium]
MIEKTLEYIASNFQEPISLKILAKQANYSSFHFQRVFKSKTGETPKEYITRLRVQKASRELLLFPKKNIYSITIDCGFNSQSDFARTFKKFTGKSPTDFRNCEIEKTELQISELKQCIETKYCPSFNLVGNIINLSDESKIIQSFKELITWAMARELLQKDFMAYGVFLDSPYLTTLKKCRYYTAIKSYDGNDYEDKSSLRIERGKFA